MDPVVLRCTTLTLAGTLVGRACDDPPFVFPFAAGVTCFLACAATMVSMAHASFFFMVVLVASSPVVVHSDDTQHTSSYHCVDQRERGQLRRPIRGDILKRGSSNFGEVDTASL